MMLKRNADFPTKGKGRKEKHCKIIHRKFILSQTLSSTDFFSWHICRFFLDSATATPITATMRKRWIGLKRSQATASWGLKQPLMAREELASSALTSRPWSEIQASRRDAGTGRVRSEKLLERRREEGNGIGENEARETNEGAASKKPSSLSASSMAWRKERDCNYLLKMLWIEIEYLLLVLTK